EWIRRQSRINQDHEHRDLQDWSSQFLLIVAFRLGWNPQKISSFLSLTRSSLSFRGLQVLKGMIDVDTKELRIQGKDCVRCDLFYLDLVLKTEWSDPLKLFDREVLLRHQKACPRCSRL